MNKDVNSEIDSVLFLGSKKIGYESLIAIYEANPKILSGIITIDDREDSRSVYDNFHIFANTHQLDIYVVRSQIAADEIILNVKPKLCFVIGWYWIVRQEILNEVPFGFLGIHSSLLPQYRGGSPLVWSLIRGEKVVGTTLFSLSDGMDDGNIYTQIKISVQDEDYISDILEKLETATIDMIRKTYPLILNNSIQSFPQNHELATFCAQRIPEDGLIDWSNRSMDIYNFIRAQSHPYPGAYTKFNDQKLIIWKASLKNQIYYGTPGQVASIKDGLVYVICGDQKPIALEYVQLDGCLPAYAGDIIKTRSTRFK